MRRITVRAIIEHEGKFLMVRHHQNDFWNTVGGGMDDGESVLDCLHREVIEETGIEPVAGDLLYVQQFAEGDVEFLEFFFAVKNGADYLSIDLKSTTHGASELAEVSFVDIKERRILPEFLGEELPRMSEACGAKFVTYL